MIELKSLSFCYEAEHPGQYLKDINLTIEDGEVVLICGESGCGKTTITRIINGLIPNFFSGHLTGTVRVQGQDVANQPIYETAKTVGSVFQNPRSQFFNVDTDSELAFACENMGWSVPNIEARLHQVVEDFKIEHLMGRDIFELSGGEKQKIACASVSMPEPSVMVLDEPSSSLDYFSINDLQKLLALWKKQGKTIVIAEHRLYYLRDIVDRVVFMKAGSIVQEFTGKDFFALPAAAITSLGMRHTNLSALSVQKNPLRSFHNLVLENFAFSYRGTQRQVLNIDRLEVPQAAVIAIIGKNGAGKSTFAHCLCGLEKRCEGKMDGMNRRQRLKKCYMVMQDVNHQLFTESVLEEVLISMDSENENQAVEILKSLDLSDFHDKHPLSLSGGQKQRVAIASAIASEREYIIFDEPTSGLDLRHMEEVGALLQNLIGDGKTVFLITHDLELIFKCCTYILCFDAGKVVDGYVLDDEGAKKLKKYYGLSDESKSMERVL